jgi:hypothetical protein
LSTDKAFRTKPEGRTQSLKDFEEKNRTSAEESSVEGKALMWKDTIHYHGESIGRYAAISSSRWIQDPDPRKWPTSECSDYKTNQLLHLRSVRER